MGPSDPLTSRLVAQSATAVKTLNLGLMSARAPEMPNRVLRDGLIYSSAVSAVSEFAELLYLHMIVSADDFGLIEWTPAYLRGKCVPTRDWSIEKICALQTELEAQQLVRIYESAGKRYAAITKWIQRRFAKKSKCPMPPWGMEHILGGYVDPRIVEKEKPQIIAPVSLAPINGTPVALIPLNDGTEFAVSEELAQELAALYPEVNVKQTLNEIRGWNLANPTRRKTRRGIANHINHWMAKEQNRGPQR
jgi:hypothetical protein